jgi:hypothetical protein
MTKAKKTFVRFDSNGNMIPGTMINAIKMPTDGYWIEIKDNKKCCNPYTVVTCTPNPLPYGALFYRLYCSSTGLNLYYYTGGSAETVNDIVDIANDQLSWLGLWTTNGTTVSLQMKQTLIDTMVCEGAYTLTIGDD